MKSENISSVLRLYLTLTATTESLVTLINALHVVAGKLYVGLSLHCSIAGSSHQMQLPWNAFRLCLNVFTLTFLLRCYGSNLQMTSVTF